MNRRKKTTSSFVKAAIILIAVLVVAAAVLSILIINRENREEASVKHSVSYEVLADETTEESDVEAENPSTDYTATEFDESKNEKSNQPESEDTAESASEAQAKPEREPDEIDTVVSSMTLREKICQMIILSPEDLEGNGTVIYADSNTKKALEKYPVGGIVYSTKNMKSRDQVKNLLDVTQSYSKIPLILTCDEEGGRVTRLMHTVGTTQVDAMLDYKDEGTETAYKNAQTLSGDLISCGFNMDLAPVADVLTNPENTVIGDRAYSDDPEQAAELVGAAVRGFNDSGMTCIIKHFPGHGSTVGDSHYGSVYVTKTLDELRACDLIPFKEGIEAGADAVMMGHLLVTKVDSEPAVFSERIVTGLLRGELGFDGVIMTDALNMKAISDHYTASTSAVKAVKAGVDMLLCPTDVDATIKALTDAVESGEISEERINESVRRILIMKKTNGIIK